MPRFSVAISLLAVEEPHRADARVEAAATTSGVLRPRTRALRAAATSRSAARPRASTRAAEAPCSAGRSPRPWSTFFDSWKSEATASIAFVLADADLRRAVGSPRRHEPRERGRRAPRRAAASACRRSRARAGRRRRPRRWRSRDDHRPSCRPARVVVRSRSAGGVTSLSHECSTYLPAQRLVRERVGAASRPRRSSALVREVGARGADVELVVERQPLTLTGVPA